MIYISRTYGKTLSYINGIGFTANLGRRKCATCSAGLICLLKVR